MTHSCSARFVIKKPIIIINETMEQGGKIGNMQQVRAEKQFISFVVVFILMFIIYHGSLATLGLFCNAAACILKR